MIRAMPRATAAVSVPAAERPSKTRRKAEMHELQALGEALAALPAARLQAIELPDELRDAFAELRRIRAHEGRRRQLQYVGRLMRDVDALPLREALARERLPGARATLALHRAEQWRDALLADDDALARLVAEHPHADAVALRRAVRAARAEPVAADGRHGRNYRELFRLLKEVLGDE